MASVKEYLLKTNKYNRPLELKDQDAIYTLIIRLLLLEPGTIPTHPKMGIGLRSRYRYNDVSSVTTLRVEIKEQMKTYLPDLLCIDVATEIAGDILIIYINTESATYGLSFSQSNGELKQITLEDLKK